MPKPSSVADRWGVTRALRANAILAQVQAAARDHGRWDCIDFGAGRIARVWIVNLGGGLEATFTTRWSGVSNTPGASDYDEALLIQQTPPPPEDDIVVDLDLEGFGRVLSIGMRNGVTRVIGMTPGPWEAHFCLPVRDWPAAVQRRVSSRGAA